MRFACLLLTILGPAVFAEEFTLGDYELSWPAGGKFRLAYDSEYVLTNPGITVTDASGKLCYRAPAGYTPPIATLMHPMGGDEVIGNPLDAGGGKDHLTLLGRAEGIVSIDVSGGLNKDGLLLRWDIRPAKGMCFAMTFELISPENQWKNSSQGASTFFSEGSTVVTLTRKEGRFELDVARKKEKTFVFVRVSKPTVFEIRFKGSNP